MPDITPPDPVSDAHGPHSPSNPHPDTVAEPDWAEAFACGPGRLWAIPTDEPTAGFDIPAGLRLTETDLAAADVVVEDCARVIDGAFAALLGVDQLGDAYRAAWAELRPHLEQRLCDCPRDPYHRADCPATPIWTRTVHDLVAAGLCVPIDGWFYETLAGWPL
jgi:hypothetical protein